MTGREEAFGKWDPGVLERFRAYYAPIMGKDLEPLMEALQRPLPCTFRVPESTWAGVLRGSLAENPLVCEVPWAAGAYHTLLSRDELTARTIAHSAPSSRDAHTLHLHRFLKAHTPTASVTRQELVSMVPVMALDPAPGSAVLDLCAAPGSKSSQILEALGADGILVANDRWPRRTDLLVTQTKRFAHPGLIITCNDAAAYPNIRALRFDRVLCDVPCSGDGTIRKNPHILRNKWSEAEAQGLFSVQCRILKRGLELLRPGGVLVYSTCSLNVLENERVVQAVLSGFGPQVEIEPFDIPGLVMRRGISAGPSMPGGLGLPLERCKRILPHDQDTGGFFIARIRKKELAPEPEATGESEQPQTHPTGKIRDGSGLHEAAFYAVGPELRAHVERTWGGLRGLELVSRSPSARTLYGVTPQVTKVLQSASPALRIVFAGLRVLVCFSAAPQVGAPPSSCRWRIPLEGLKFWDLKDSALLCVPWGELLAVVETDAWTPSLLGRRGLFILQSAQGSITVRVPASLGASAVSVIIEKAQRRALAECMKLVP